MLLQQLRVVVYHGVRRVPTPVSDDLSAHSGIHELKNPSSSEGVHSYPRKAVTWSTSCKMFDDATRHYLNCSSRFTVIRLLQDGDVRVGVFPECEEV
jgi:hypothetical protein